MSLEFVAGSTIDFVDELAGQYFQITNPNATASVGVGRHLPSEMITIASWNVNSIKVRLDAVLSWLKEFNCDILLMQELKDEQRELSNRSFS